MIDIHHHLLFGLDDGSPDLATSIAMARMAVDDGISHVVCTPHANGTWPYQPDVIAARAAQLRTALADEGIPLTLAIACDFHLSYDNIQDALAHPKKYSIDGNGYLLIELPDYGLAPTLTDTFYQMQLAGLTPILTHPERNPTLQRDHHRLAEWMRNGMIVQVTAASVTGRFGKEAEKMAHKLLTDRWVHVLATDAHNLTSRPPQMRAARDFVAQRYGPDYAQVLTTDNPRAIFFGEPLPPQPTPLNLFTGRDDDDSETRPWWKRLLRR